jgi:hypothetical protein
MKRREFIGLLGSVLACPFSRTAGEASQCRTIGGRYAFHLERLDRRVCSTVGTTRVDRRTRDHDRVSLGGGPQRAIH